MKEIIQSSLKHKHIPNSRVVLLNGEADVPWFASKATTLCASVETKKLFANYVFGYIPTKTSDTRYTLPNLLPVRSHSFQVSIPPCVVKC